MEENEKVQVDTEKDEMGMHEQKSQNANQLINELQEVQMQLAGVTSARFDKETSLKVEGTLDKKKSDISVQAKKYGQDVTLAEPSIAKYGEGLEAVRSEFSMEKNALLINIADLNETEVKSLKEAVDLKLEMEDKNLDEETLTKNASTLEENKKVAEAAKEGTDSLYQGIDDTKEEFYDFFGDITEEKSLVPQEKKSKISEFFSNITSKINGKKKFETQVIDPLEEKTDEIIEEKVSEANEKAKNGFNDKVKSAFGKIKQKIEELGEKAAEKLEKMNISKKMVQALMLAAKGVGVVLGAYNIVNLGLDATKTIGSWINEKMPDKALEGGLEI